MVAPRPETTLVFPTVKQPITLMNFREDYNDIFEGLEKDEFLIFVLGLGFQGGS